MAIGQGASIVIPTYGGREWIKYALQSISEQTLEKHLLEIIVVNNGGTTDSLQKLKNICERFDDLQTKVIHVNQPGVATARNIGIAASSKEFVTFLDDDDFLEPACLEAALNTSTEREIVALPMKDVGADDEKVHDSPLALRIKGNGGKRRPLHEVPWVLGYNGGKLVPRKLIQELRYDPALRSGEDVVFWSELLKFPAIKVSFVPPGRTAYVRRLVPNSISRRTESFDFNVCQRIECIEGLQRIHLRTRVGMDARQFLERSQAQFIFKFVSSNPNQAVPVFQKLMDSSIGEFDWTRLDRGPVEELVFSYCFPPYADSSATVVAKRLLEKGMLVDVISNQMEGIRPKDPTLQKVVSRVVNRHEIVQTPPSFSNYHAVMAYAGEASKIAHRWEARGTPYQRIYSRSMWIGSHAAAAIFCKDRPEVYWKAEFSDPMTLGTDGNNRQGSVARNNETEDLYKLLENAGWDTGSIGSIFELIEASTFCRADELVFTNKSQLKLVAGRYPADVRAQILKKSKVGSQPVPGSYMYHVDEINYEVDSQFINIGYFGRFYKNRGLTEVLMAISKMPPESRAQIALHVFSPESAELSNIAEELDVAGQVVLNSPLPYLQFLSVLENFDILLVNDTRVPPLLRPNPFLPSKYSDYRGSGKAIWSLVGDDSPLSELPARYKSSVGDVDEAVRILQSMVDQS